MNTVRVFLLAAILAMPAAGIVAQQREKNSEDALAASETLASPTSIGGYGNAYFQHNANNAVSHMSLERFVLFLGHRFSPSIALFSELEVEDAKISGGEAGGEVALEQAYLRFTLSKDAYLVAGLFLPRIGILNENHLPTDFHGNERTRVERSIIPSTWRELGVGLYGSIARLGARYSVAVMNGLNAASFEHGTVIRGGRFEGRDATGNALAVTGALQFSAGDLTLQVSGYAGGSNAASARASDTLGFGSGVLSLPVYLGEADARYASGGFSAKALGTFVFIRDAEAINRAYANATPRSAYGAYAEAAYDLFYGVSAFHGKQLIAFARGELLDMNASVPSNGIVDRTLRQQHLILGLTYLPVPNVAVKGDVRFARTLDAGVILPGTLPARASNTFVNVGVGYSF